MEGGEKRGKIRKLKVDKVREIFFFLISTDFERTLRIRFIEGRCKGLAWKQDLKMS